MLLRQSQMRRIGVLMLYPENDPAGQLRAKAFRLARGIKTARGGAWTGVQASDILRRA